MGYSREVLDQVKTQILKETAQMRKANQIVPVSGERIDLPAGKDGRSINIVLYRTEEKNCPLIIGYHGGGFLFGGNALNDAMWCAVRDRLHASVASVEYRKSPEYQWREGLEDAWDAAVYLYDHADAFGFDRNRISVMGGSAGAAMAATVALYAKQQGRQIFRNQILLYPFLDSATDPDSKGPGSLQGPIMYVFNELHCKPEEAKNPLVSPVFATKEEVQGLPKAIFCLAENDALKYEGRKYEELLRNAGVDTVIREYPGMPHGFFDFGFGEFKDEEVSFLAEEDIQLIRSGDMHRASVQALDFIAENVTN